MNTIKLYRNVPLNVKNNYIIDDIDLFLENYEIDSIDNFMFIDTSKLENTIILNYVFDEVDYASKAFSGINYISLEQAGRTYYYFVSKCEFASRNAVRLHVRMDTLNTFNNQYELSNRTLIIREHKDRFQQPFEVDEGGTIVNYYPRIVDKNSEGLNPQLYSTSISTLQNPELWYLIYRNEKPITDEAGTLVEVNPVECSIVPKYSQNVAGDTEKSLYFDDLDASVGEYIYCFLIEGGYNIFDLSGYRFSLVPEYYDNDGEFRNVRMVVLEKQSNGEIKLTAYHKKDASHQTATRTIRAGVPVEFIGQWDYIYYSMEEPEANYEKMYARAKTFFSRQQIGTIWRNQSKSISDIDRTDSRLIKIIELPYKPFAFNVNSLPESLHYYCGEFVLTDLSTTFTNTIATNKIIPNMYYRNNINQVTAINIANHEWPIQEILESKLTHSDFYYHKVFYDSFSTAIQNELIDSSSIHNVGSLYYTVDFVTTTTINSRFFFKLNFLENLFKYNNQDFNHIINVARSNELTIYNNAYINYIRAGYNYDVKSKQRNITSSWVGVGLSAIGTIASFASSAYTGGVGIAAGITLATGTAAQVYNAVNNQIQSEQNFAAKLQQLEMQSASVYGADDIDLLNAYGGQDLRIARYECSAHIKELLLKLFYLNGYTSNRYGLPYMQSRTIFDFCQANIVFEKTYNIPEDMLNDIITRFGEGVYDFHKLTYQDNTKGWDLSFTHENLETWLYNDFKN